MVCTLSQFLALLISVYEDCGDCQHGMCFDGSCACDFGFTGPSCSIVSEAMNSLTLGENTISLVVDTSN